MPISTIGQNGLTVPLTTSGSLGIGTASPTSPLQVNTAGVNTTVQINSTDANGGYGANIALNNTGTGGRQYAIYSTSNADGEVGGGKFKFYDVTASATRMLIDSSGNLLVGTTSLAVASTRFSVVGSTAAGTGVMSTLNSNSNTKPWHYGPDANGNFVVFNPSNTGAYIAYGATSWTGNSDERIKDIIEPITNAVEKVSTLRAVIGKFKNDEDGTRRSFLIAQDVQAVLPEAVDVQSDEQGTLGLRYQDVIPLLVAATKELKAINDQQAETINALTARIVALEAK